MTLFRKKGDWGEAEATRLLKKKGYKILAKNFRVLTGEIDIVALQKKILVFVEVKYRENSLFHPIFSVDNAKQKKILSAADSFLLKNIKYQNVSVRFDIVTIQKRPDMSMLIEHFENAFS